MVPKRANYWLTVMVLGVWLTESVMSKCTQDGPCKCKTDKGTIDLNPINSKVPAFEDVADQQDAYLFSYSPCIPFTEGSQECQSVAVCQLTKDFANSFPAGTVDSAKWDTDSSGDNTVTYTKTDSTGLLRTTIVTLKCIEGADHLVVHGEDPVRTGYYTMTLKSAHCCVGSGPSPSPGPKGGSSGSISAGSVICIVALVLVVVYIAGGIAYQKGVRKAQGKETFPNYNFWSSIPGLIKDGFLFTIGGCKRRGGYDKV